MAGTIMIVEDEPAVARGVQVALEREGYATAIVGTGEEAIARFADIAPDLELLDVRLPGIDGFGVCRQLRRGALVIALERRRVPRDGERISLTTTEFDLLRHMAAKPGRVYTRTQLLELVRDYEALEADERTINVHVSHIREKIEPDPAQPRYIKTVRGVGYAFSE